MISVINYGAGNLQSILNVLDELKANYIVTGNEFEINKSDKIIFPGVGEASFAMKKLHLLNLSTMLRITKKPLLGICLGMQLLAEKSDEGNVACLGIIPTTCRKYDEASIKVPHMGWNKVSFSKTSKLFNGIPDNSYFYFANSFYVPINDNSYAFSEYSVKFTAAIEKDNYYGVQFHPEKSGDNGIQLIKNFIELC